MLCMAFCFSLQVIFIPWWTKEIHTGPATVGRFERLSHRIEVMVEGFELILLNTSSAYERIGKLYEEMQDRKNQGKGSNTASGKDGTETPDKQFFDEIKLLQNEFLQSWFNSTQNVGDIRNPVAAEKSILPWFFRFAPISNISVKIGSIIIGNPLLPTLLVTSWRQSKTLVFPGRCPISRRTDAGMYRLHVNTHFEEMASWFIYNSCYNGDLGTARVQSQNAVESIMNQIRKTVDEVWAQPDDLEYDGGSLPGSMTAMTRRVTLKPREMSTRGMHGTQVSPSGASNEAAETGCESGLERLAEILKECQSYGEDNKFLSVSSLYLDFYTDMQGVDAKHGVAKNIKISDEETADINFHVQIGDESERQLQRECIVNFGPWHDRQLKLLMYFFLPYTPEAQVVDSQRLNRTWLALHFRSISPIRVKVPFSKHVIDLPNNLYEAAAKKNQCFQNTFKDVESLVDFLEKNQTEKNDSPEETRKLMSVHQEQAAQINGFYQNENTVGTENKVTTTDQILFMMEFSGPRSEALVRGCTLDWFELTIKGEDGSSSPCGRGWVVFENYLGNAALGSLGGTHMSFDNVSAYEAVASAPIFQLNKMRFSNTHRYPCQWNDPQNICNSIILEDGSAVIGGDEVVRIKEWIRCWGALYEAPWLPHSATALARNPYLSELGKYLSVPYCSYLEIKFLRFALRLFGNPDNVEGYPSRKDESVLVTIETDELKYSSKSHSGGSKQKLAQSARKMSGQADSSLRFKEVSGDLDSDHKIFVRGKKRRSSQDMQKDGVKDSESQFSKNCTLFLELPPDHPVLRMSSSSMNKLPLAAFSSVFVQLNYTSNYTAFSPVHDSVLGNVDVSDLMLNGSPECLQGVWDVWQNYMGENTIPISFAKWKRFGFQNRMGALFTQRYGLLRPGLCSQASCYKQVYTHEQASFNPDMRELDTQISVQLVNSSLLFLPSTVINEELSPQTFVCKLENVDLSYIASPGQAEINCRTSPTIVTSGCPFTRDESGNKRHKEILRLESSRLTRFASYGSTRPDSYGLLCLLEAETNIYLGRCVVEIDTKDLHTVFDYIHHYTARKDLLEPGSCLPQSIFPKRAMKLTVSKLQLQPPWKRYSTTRKDFDEVISMAESAKEYSLMPREATVGKNVDTPNGRVPVSFDVAAGHRPFFVEPQPSGWVLTLNSGGQIQSSPVGMVDKDGIISWSECMDRFGNAAEDDITFEIPADKDIVEFSVWEIWTSWYFERNHKDGTTRVDQISVPFPQAVGALRTSDLLGLDSADTRYEGDDEETRTGAAKENEEQYNFLPLHLCGESSVPNLSSDSAYAIASVKAETASITGDFLMSQHTENLADKEAMEPFEQLHNDQQLVDIGNKFSREVMKIRPTNLNVYLVDTNLLACNTIMLEMNSPFHYSADSNGKTYLTVDDLMLRMQVWSCLRYTDTDAQSNSESQQANRSSDAPGFADIFVLSGLYPDKLQANCSCDFRIVSRSSHGDPSYGSNMEKLLNYFGQCTMRRDKPNDRRFKMSIPEDFTDKALPQLPELSLEIAPRFGDILQKWMESKGLNSITNLRFTPISEETEDKYNRVTTNTDKADSFGFQVIVKGPLNVWMNSECVTQVEQFALDLFYYFSSSPAMFISYINSSKEVTASSGPVSLHVPDADIALYNFKGVGRSASSVVRLTISDTDIKSFVGDNCSLSVTVKKTELSGVTFVDDEASKVLFSSTAEKLQYRKSIDENLASVSAAFVDLQVHRESIKEMVAFVESLRDFVGECSKCATECSRRYYARVEWIRKALKSVTDKVGLMEWIIHRSRRHKRDSPKVASKSGKNVGELNTSGDPIQKRRLDRKSWHAGITRHDVSTCILPATRSNRAMSFESYLRPKSSCHDDFNRCVNLLSSEMPNEELFADDTSQFQHQDRRVDKLLDPVRNLLATTAGTRERLNLLDSCDTNKDPILNRLKEVERNLLQIVALRLAQIMKENEVPYSERFAYHKSTEAKPRDFSLHEFLHRTWEKETEYLQRFANRIEKSKTSTNVSVGKIVVGLKDDISEPLSELNAPDTLDDPSQSLCEHCFRTSGFRSFGIQIDCVVFNVENEINWLSFEEHEASSSSTIYCNHIRVLAEPDLLSAGLLAFHEHHTAGGTHRLRPHALVLPSKKYLPSKVSTRDSSTISACVSNCSIDILGGDNSWLSLQLEFSGRSSNDEVFFSIPLALLKLKSTSYEAVNEALKMTGSPSLWQCSISKLSCCFHGSPVVAKYIKVNRIFSNLMLSPFLVSAATDALMEWENESATMNISLASLQKKYEGMFTANVNSLATKVAKSTTAALVTRLDFKIFASPILSVDYSLKKLNLNQKSEGQNMRLRVFASRQYVELIREKHVLFQLELPTLNVSSSVLSTSGGEPHTNVSCMVEDMEAEFSEHSVASLIKVQASSEDELRFLFQRISEVYYSLMTSFSYVSGTAQDNSGSPLENGQQGGIFDNLSILLIQSHVSFQFDVKDYESTRRLSFKGGPNCILLEGLGEENDEKCRLPHVQMTFHSIVLQLLECYEGIKGDSSSKNSDGYIMSLPVPFASLEEINPDNGRDGASEDSGALQGKTVTLLKNLRISSSLFVPEAVDHSLMILPPSTVFRVLATSESTISVEFTPKKKDFFVTQHAIVVELLRSSTVVFPESLQWINSFSERISKLVKDSTSTIQSASKKGGTSTKNSCSEKRSRADTRNTPAFSASSGDSGLADNLLGFYDDDFTLDITVQLLIEKATLACPYVPQWAEFGDVSTMLRKSTDASLGSVDEDSSSTGFKNPPEKLANYLIENPELIPKESTLDCVDAFCISVEEALIDAKAVRKSEFLAGELDGDATSEHPEDGEGKVNRLDDWRGSLTCAISEISCGSRSSVGVDLLTHRSSAMKNCKIPSSAGFRCNIPKIEITAALSHGEVDNQEEALLRTSIHSTLSTDALHVSANAACLTDFYAFLYTWTMSHSIDKAIRYSADRNSSGLAMSSTPAILGEEDVEDNDDEPRLDNDVEGKGKEESVYPLKHSCQVLVTGFTRGGSARLYSLPHVAMRGMGKDVSSADEGDLLFDMPLPVLHILAKDDISPVSWGEDSSPGYVHLGVEVRQLTINPDLFAFVQQLFLAWRTIHRPRQICLTGDIDDNGMSSLVYSGPFPVSSPTPRGNREEVVISSRTSTDKKRQSVNPQERKFTVLDIDLYTKDTGAGVKHQPPAMRISCEPIVKNVEFLCYLKGPIQTSILLEHGGLLGPSNGIKFDTCSVVAPKLSFKIVQQENIDVGYLIAMSHLNGFKLSLARRKAEDRDDDALEHNPINEDTVPVEWYDINVVLRELYYRVFTSNIESAMMLFHGWKWKIEETGHALQVMLGLVGEEYQLTPILADAYGYNRKRTKDPLQFFEEVIAQPEKATLPQFLSNPSLACRFFFRINKFHVDMGSSPKSGIDLKLSADNIWSLLRLDDWEVIPKAPGCTDISAGIEQLQYLIPQHQQAIYGVVKLHQLYSYCGWEKHRDYSRQLRVWTCVRVGSVSAKLEESQVDPGMQTIPVLQLQGDDIGLKFGNTMERKETDNFGYMGRVINASVHVAPNVFVAGPTLFVEPFLSLLEVYYNSAHRLYKNFSDKSVFGRSDQPGKNQMLVKLHDYLKQAISSYIELERVKLQSKMEPLALHTEPLLALGRGEISIDQLEVIWYPSSGTVREVAKMRIIGKYIRLGVRQTTTRSQERHHQPSLIRQLSVLARSLALDHSNLRLDYRTRKYGTDHGDVLLHFPSSNLSITTEQNIEEVDPMVAIPHDRQGRIQSATLTTKLSNELWYQFRSKFNGSIGTSNDFRAYNSLTTVNRMFKPKLDQARNRLSTLVNRLDQAESLCLDCHINRELTMSLGSDYFCVKSIPDLISLKARRRVSTSTAQLNFTPDPRLERSEAFQFNPKFLGELYLTSILNIFGIRVQERIPEVFFNALSTPTIGLLEFVRQLSDAFENNGEDEYQFQ